MKHLFLKIDNYYLFSFILILLLFLTTNHYSYEQALLLNQLDSKSYYLISKNSPELLYNQEIPYHHYQRFLLPYFVGIISDFFDFDIFSIYKFLTILVLILISIIHKKILIKVNQNFETSIILLSIVIFSPYFARYVMSIPLMLVDLSFVLISYMVILTYLFKSKWIYLLIQLCLFFRLSGIAIIIGYLASAFFNFKKNFLKIFFTTTSSFVIIFLLGLIANRFTDSEFSNLHYLGLIKEFNLSQLLHTIIFILKPLIIFIPIFILFIFFRFEKKKFDFKDSIFFLSIPLMLIGQPILGGEMVTGNNIFRLSSLALPFLIIYFSILFKPMILIKNYYLYLIIFNFIYSLHPKYSILSFLVN